MKKEIKVDSWITARKDGRAVLDQVEKVEDNYILTKGGLNFWGPSAQFETIELWVPKKGERCIFWDNGDDEFIISKFRGMSENNYPCSQLDYWENMAPLKFIQKLGD